MLDSYHVSAVTERVTEHVHEHRAPTDESVKLLREMEDEARKAVIASIHLKDNHFDSKVQVYSDNLSRHLTFKISFSLNHQILWVEHVVDFYELESKGTESVLTEIRDKMAKKIASIILSDSLNKADRSHTMNKLLKHIGERP